jgi:hypothetical protein
MTTPPGPTAQREAETIRIGLLGHVESGATLGDAGVVLCRAAPFL